MGEDMQKTRERASVIGALLFVAVSTIAQAQNASMTLGSGAGSAGGTVKLPLYITLPGDMQLKLITATVKYPPNLALRQAAIGPEVQASGESIEAIEGAPGSDGTKRITLTLKAGKDKPLLSGLTRSLSFSVVEKAKAGMVALPVDEVRGIRWGDGAEVPLRGNPGQVTIYEAGKEPQPTPMAGCFFFTH